MCSAVIKTKTHEGFNTFLFTLNILCLFPLGFDLMDYFNVRDILGTRDEPGQSSYVRLGTMPIVQQTE